MKYSAAGYLLANMEWRRETLQPATACVYGGHSALIVMAGRLLFGKGGVVPGEYSRRAQKKDGGGCLWNTVRTPLRAVSMGRPRRFRYCAPASSTGT
jgi:hypothetical protein